MKKIKIAHILHSVGGVDIWMRLNLKNINPEKYDNIVIHGDEDTNKQFFDKKNNPVKEFKIPIERNISIIRDLKAIRQACKIIKSENPDIIHVHSAKAGVIGRIVGYLFKIPVLYTPHAFSYLSAEGNMKKSIYLIIEKILSKGNSILISTSESENERGINEAGYHKHKAIIYNNSINAIAPVQPLKIDKTWPDNYICTVGRPSYQKNIELMLHVVNEIRKVQDIHLIVMGVGLVQDRIESVLSLIKTLKLEKDVTLLKWTDRSDVFNIINNSKLYISTSRYEGMPYSVIESLSLSKPCVVSNCDGNKDLIRDGFNGYVIKSDNPLDYAEKIIKLLKDDILRNKFSLNAKSSFDTNYNLDSNIAKLEDIYCKYSKSKY